jgi:ATP-binding cassette subfamily F protein 3
MIADITVTEKSFGPKVLMTGIKFSIDDSEKVGVIGRNGIGKSTLFGILAGTDKDFTGEVIYKKGTTVVATAQEHHDLGETTVLQYVLAGLPEYPKLSRIIETYPETMGDDMKKIEEYTTALQRFDDKGFYQVEEKIERELDNFQLPGVAHRPFRSLSGGQKRLVEVIKIMHSDAHLALIDEPTNHMDYVAKGQFIDWLKQAPEAMLIITHDRDVLQQVDRIVELKDGTAHSYKGNYDDYLRQNATSTSSQMNEYEVTQRQIDNLKKRVAYARSKKASWGGTADKRNPFVVMENKAMREMRELQKIAKPTFWIDKDSAEQLDFKAAERYKKYKTRNIRIGLKGDESRSKHVLVSAKDLSLGYGDTALFSGVNIDLREGEAVELRGRNGAGKTTLIKTLLGKAPDVSLFSGELALDTHARVGIYEQEVSPQYFGMTLHDAIERMYLDRDLSISETKIRQLMSDYLFVDSDGSVPIEKLSGGQKARFQVISMLANDPQLLILDEPTNHLDLPSIEELETALGKFTGAVLYVSHDNYFRETMGGEVVQVGS